MRLGIFSKTFAAESVDAVFGLVKGCGYSATQFNFASAGLPSLPREIGRDVMRAIGRARDRHGIAIEAISATFNMAHPRASVIEDGLAVLDTVASAAAALHCRLLTLCTGTLDPNDQWRGHPENGSAAAWSTLRDSMEKALAIADRHDVLLGVEPEIANVVSSARKARTLIDSLGSDRIRIIFDPANLFERPGSTAERRRIVDEALDLLGPDIAIAHAKDRRADGAFAVAGRGVLDYPHYLSRLKECGFDGCVVAHGLAAADAEFVSAMLSGLLGANRT